MARARQSKRTDQGASVAPPQNPEPAPTPAAEVRAATSEARAFVTKRFRAWFGQKSKRYRILFIIAVLIILGLLLQLLVQAGLSFQSLRSDDLVLFIQSGNESVQVPHGSDASVAFTLGTSNLNLCEATCAWNITDVSAGAVLASGSDPFKDGDERTYTARVHAKTGESTVPVQFVVACRNAPSSYCKSSASVRHNTATTMVRSVYTPAEQQAHDALVTELPAWQVEVTAHARILAGIGSLDDPRLGSLPADAASELTSLKERFAALSTSLSAADVTAAHALLAPVSTSTVDTYAALVDMEAATAALYNGLLVRQPEADAVLALANATDRATFVNAGNAATLSVAKFSTRSLGLSKETFLAWNDTLTNLSAVYTPLALSDASRAQQLLFSEERAACALKAGPCPVPSPAPTNLTDSVASLRSSCTEYASLSQYFDAAEHAYEQSLDPLATEAALLASYGVAQARLDPSFEQVSAGLYALARNGTLGTTNDTLRLAVVLNASNETRTFFGMRCPLSEVTAGLPSAPLKPSLVSDPSRDVALPYLAVPVPQCCSLAGCSACGAQTRYPVVFVHGHSFSARTTPEYSLSTFTALAFALEQDGVLYLGQAFPREDIASIPYGEFGGLPGGESFVITYYYDSYPEEGEQSLISRKSENIETYAIRLKEVVDVVRQKTGSPKVVIVAHSMGGLVARRYVQLFGEDATAAMILVGTPNHGITGTTSKLCPLFGGDKECADMDAGSVFLTKLNAGKQPTFPVYVIAGTGCDNRAFDGVVDTDSVVLPFANNTVVNGTCPDSNNLLHSTLLDPTVHPEVSAQIKTLISQLAVPK